MPRARQVKPLSLIVRLGIATAAMLWLGHWIERPVVSSSLPALRTLLTTATRDFSIINLDLTHKGPNETLRLRADYSHPIVVGKTVVYPINSPTELRGWLQVNLTLGGTLQYGLLLLSVVLAWPLQNPREYFTRLALALPSAILLTTLNVVSTLLAELWFGPHDDLAPNEWWPLLNLEPISDGRRRCDVGDCDGGGMHHLGTAYSRPAIH